jgi:hypothetical protein
MTLNEEKMMKPKHSETNTKQGHSHAKHMWMMAICCGLPIVGFLAIGALGVSAPSLETLIALICPIGMVGMMYMMHRDSRKKEGGHSCCHTESTEEKTESGLADNGVKGTEKVPAQAEQPGTFRA